MPTTFTHPDLSAAAAADVLRAAGFEVDPPRVSYRVLLDTFDGRLHAAGLRLELRAEPDAALVLIDGNGAPPARLAWRSVPRWPADLPAGPFRARVADLTEERALLPLVTITSARERGPPARPPRQGRGAGRGARAGGGRWRRGGRVAGRGHGRGGARRRARAVAHPADRGRDGIRGRRCRHRGRHGRGSRSAGPHELAHGPARATRARARRLPPCARQPGRHHRRQPARDHRRRRRRVPARAPRRRAPHPLGARRGQGRAAGRRAAAVPRVVRVAGPDHRRRPRPRRLRHRLGRLHGAAQHGEPRQPRPRARGAREASPRRPRRARSRPAQRRVRRAARLLARRGSRTPTSRLPTIVASGRSWPTASPSAQRKVLTDGRAITPATRARAPARPAQGHEEAPLPARVLRQPLPDQGPQGLRRPAQGAPGQPRRAPGRRGAPGPAAASWPTTCTLGRPSTPTRCSPWGA